MPARSRSPTSRAWQWQPAAGLENGYLRFTVRNAATEAPPGYDPNAVELWGFKKDPLTALVAAAVQARLPHPARAAGDVVDARPELPSPPVASAGDDHDALLRRLRELGELHRTGVPTDNELSLAKQAILKRMQQPRGATSPGAPP
ncbi:uncharacterized protein SAZU_4919 [Streptomyces azureus]|uniref:DUF4429 domain-containing protein n=1 Tax=Streptomyces azureus TaxID=146537 RepID=A0A0K8PQD0_STRAJ|nr:uncharacterized protein SAZU_4919 [Streptomyces azureus]